MTDEQEIKCAIRKLQCEREKNNTPSVDIAYARAIEALKKQIPKKPNKAIDRTWGIEKEVNVCPVCDSYLTEVHFIAPQKIEHNKKITFCETCGQAINWDME